MLSTSVTTSTLPGTLPLVPVPPSGIDSKGPANPRAPKLAHPTPVNQTLDSNSSGRASLGKLPRLIPDLLKLNSQTAEANGIRQGVACFQQGEMLGLFNLTCIYVRLP